MSSTLWSNTSPASGNVVGEGDDRIREDKQGTYERLKQGGHHLDNADAVGAATENHDGKHVVGAGPNGGPHVYRSDKTTKLVNYTNDTTVDMTNATSGILGPNITTGTDPGHKHSGSIVFRIPGTQIAGRTGLLFSVGRAIEIYSVKIIVGTIPTAGTFDLDVLDLGTPADNVSRAGVAGQTIFEVAGARPKLVFGDGKFSDTAAGATDFFNGTGGTSQYTLAANRELAFHIISAGTTTADLVIIILARKL